MAIAALHFHIDSKLLSTVREFFYLIQQPGILLQEVCKVVRNPAFRRKLRFETG